MKKILIIFTLIFSLCAYSFADSYNSYSDYYDNASNNYNSKQTQKAFAPGFKFSVLGLAPTLSLNRNNLELESTLYMMRNTETNFLNLLPSFTLGYNTKPFSKGFQALFGLNYTFANSKLIEMDEGEEGFFHAAFFHLRTAYQWKSGISFYTSMLFPLFVYSEFEDGKEIYTIVDRDTGLPFSIAMGACTFSLGLKILIRY